MAKVPANIIKTLNKYVKELENNKYHIEQAILYGSYAKGSFNEWSDIDIVLISENFQGNRYIDEDNIMDITLSVDRNISPLPFRPEDFTPDNLFVKEILKHGIRIV